jgi:hypothetical protein
MEWQGRYFVDTQQIFGAATVAANFDVLASTVLKIVLSEFNSDGLLVHRKLDDVTGEFVREPPVRRPVPAHSRPTKHPAGPRVPIK